MLLIASWYFYMCWKPEFIVLLIFSTALNFFCGLNIEKFRTNPRKSKAFFALSLFTNLGLLFCFKYMNFFGETLTALCQALSIPFRAPTLNIILPVGISFYTFQALSYTIDVYKGKLKAERDFPSFALFISFFPQLVAGPIEKASNLLPQLNEEHVFSYKDASHGLKLMAWGFFKKLVIADRLAALLVDPVFENPTNYYGGAFLIAAAAFGIQIYCDFGGYSDIARGCAQTMGIRLTENFKAPYFAASLTDFWRRWHISLTSWFREYVYIPLGGNRKGLSKKMLFVTITFCLSGLWHGAGWTFVVWGLLQALYLNAEALFSHRKQTPPPHRLPRFAGCCKGLFHRLVTLALCCFSWIFFRAASMGDALYVLRHSITGGKAPIQYVKTAISILYPGNYQTIILLFSLSLLFLFDLVNETEDPIQRVSAQPVYVRWPIYTVSFFLLLLLIPKQGAAPFIYFQF